MRKPSATEGFALEVGLIICLCRDQTIVAGVTYKAVAKAAIDVRATYTDWCQTGSVRICAPHERISLAPMLATCVSRLAFTSPTRLCAQMSHLVMDTYNGKLGSANLELCVRTPACTSLCLTVQPIPLYVSKYGDTLQVLQGHLLRSECYADVEPDQAHPQVSHPSLRILPRHLSHLPTTH